jgi:hypothetical protein
MRIPKMGEERYAVYIREKKLQKIQAKKLVVENLSSVYEERDG